MSDDTPTKPITPLGPMSNGYRRAMTGSAEEAALIQAGYSVLEHDGTVSILRRARRASDIATASIHYRALERGVLEELASEISAALTAESGVLVRFESAVLRWAMEEFRARIMRESGVGKALVSGRLR